MASISQPLLGAGAEAKNDWASAKAATSLTFTGEAQFRRGFEVAIGLNAMATAQAGLSKFVEATARGNAFAEAKATLRVQLPLNLFKDFGLTIGAQAVAQAAAGIEVGLGLAIGDFITLLRQNPESEGLPIELVVLLLDQATVGGKVEVHVSAAAMAYASIVVAGEIVQSPGFHVTAEAGLGLAAGVGFSGGLDIGIGDFRTFYGRAVDRTVASVVDDITRLLPASQQTLAPVVQALAPAAATALRVAYELGDFIAKNAPAPNHQGALDLANHCVGIVLEEAQRFLFGRFLQAGLSSLEKLITQGIQGLTQGAWDGLFPQRQALATTLLRMPAEPFQPTDDNAAYWSKLISDSVTLVAQLPAQMSEDVIRGMAIVFATTQLLTKMVASRVNAAQSYAFAIGAGTVTSPPPAFDGPLPKQPSQRISTHINTVIGESASHAIGYGDLITYLISDAVITTLRQAIPAVDTYLAIFQPALASNAADVLRALLKNREAFLPNRDGKRDPQATLSALLGALDEFLTIKIQGDLVTVVNQQLPDGNAKLYFNEVLVGTLLYTKRVAFQTVLTWESDPVDPDAFTEALAGVITMLLGRSLVLVGEGLMAAIQGDMVRACQHAASQIDSPKDPFTAMGIPASPELKALIADTLRIGGEVFGPLPEDTRRALRFTLYDVMETLPPSDAAQASFIDNLSDQFFIPNRDSLDELTQELFAISRSRFELFVQRVLEAGAQFALDAIEDFVAQAIQTILKWASDLESAISALFNQLVQLELAVRQLLNQAQQAFATVSQRLESLIGQFSNANFRTRLRQNIANEFLQRAKGVLAGNDLYRSLPQAAKDIVKGVLQDLIVDTIEGPVLNPVFDAVGAVAGELDGVLDDARALNPNEPLAPQLLDVLIDRMEDRIRDSLGGTTPRIQVGFNVNILGFSAHFGLGTISVPFETLFSIFRDAIAALDFYESALDAAAAALANAFQKSVALAAKQTQRDQAKTNHDRLSRIRSDFTSDPKTVTIVSPVQSLVYDDDIDVQIRLGGVPASYLGLGQDEQQRVLVFLNGQLIPPQSLGLADPLGDANQSSTSAPPSQGQQGAAGVDGAILAGPLGQIRVVPGLKAKTSVQSGGPTADLPLPPSLGPIAGKNVSPSQPAVSQSIISTGDGRLISTTAVGNVLPGRRLTPTKQAAFQASLPAGISIEFRVARSHLAVGSNTLVAVVIDPGGQRYQQAVSFAVTAPGNAVNPKVPVLPPLPGRPKSSEPTAPPGGIDMHLSRDVLANRLEAGRTVFAKQAAAHFQNLGVRP
jgi:hypothetical protein